VIPGLDGAFGFGLVLLRTAGLFLAAPLLGTRTVPARVRLGFSLVVAFAAFQGAGAPGVEPAGGLAGLAAAAASETALGVLAGLAARWTLDAALAAGNLAGLAAGIGFGALVDPTSGAESTAASEIVYTLAWGAAAAAGLHREAIAWLARSVSAWPPGGALPLSELAIRAVGHGAFGAALAVRMAFPVLAAVLLGHAAMALVGRMAPQLSLATIGFSAAILAGGLALYLAAPGAAELAAWAAIATLRG